jgi:hypothetical protein
VEEEGQTLIIDVHLNRRTVTLVGVTLLAACFLAYLAWGEMGVTAAGAAPSRDRAPMGPLSATSAMRQYYLTKGSFKGAEAPGACEPGFHMASLWEILDPSHLRYNTALGQRQADSGQGPVTDFGGWVRTGGASVSSTQPGYASCYGYTSSHGADYGTTIWLDTTWTGDAAAIGVWEAAGWSCNSGAPVWCVEDGGQGGGLYIPVVIRA